MVVYFIGFTMDIGHRFTIISSDYLLSGKFVNVVIEIDMRTASTPPIVNSNPHHGRDIHLLKHIIFVFLLFISGWTSTYIFLVIDPIEYMSSWISLLLRLLSLFSSLINIVDLFLNNHEIRQHFTERFANCF
jgi:hypothetical protein